MAAPVQTAQPGAAPAAAPPQVDAPTLIARFDGLVNTKTAKLGDPVSAKTIKPLKLKDLDIPKGSRLTGRVALVQSMKDGSGTSALGIRFDQVELKGGAVLRVQGLITSIGPAPKYETGLGYNSVLSRGGAGSDPSLDPSIAADRYTKDEDDLPRGSTLEGVALGLHLNHAGATEIRGVHRDMKFDSDVMIKVALFRGA